MENPNLNDKPDVTPALAGATLLDRIVAVRSNIAAARAGLLEINAIDLPEYPAGGHVGMAALSHTVMHANAADRELAELIGQLRKHDALMWSNRCSTADCG